VPFAGLLPRAGQAGTAGGPPAARAEGEPPPRDWTPVLALGGLATLALVLVVGVLIGRGSNNSSKVAGTPQVITVAGGAAAAPATGSPAANASAASITEDWPAGQTAYTIQLQAIPKAGATPDSVTAAKTAATGKGATGVGVLDASNYKARGSDYVIYSGSYPSQAKANAALAKLKKSFPAAKVIHVVPSGGAAASAAGTGAPVTAAQAAQGAAAINALTNCSGAACSKAAAKVTKPVATSGAPAPKDNSKPAGGGSSAQTIG
jgi:hypothetical protein